jgi:hypothetical protein
LLLLLLFYCFEFCLFACACLFLSDRFACYYYAVHIANKYYLCYTCSHSFVIIFIRIVSAHQFVCKLSFAVCQLENKNILYHYRAQNTDEKEATNVDTITSNNQQLLDSGSISLKNITRIRQRIDANGCDDVKVVLFCFFKFRVYL